MFNLIDTGALTVGEGEKRSIEIKTKLHSKRFADWEYACLDHWDQYKGCALTRLGAMNRGSIKMSTNKSHLVGPLFIGADGKLSTLVSIIRDARKVTGTGTRRKTGVGSHLLIFIEDLSLIRTTSYLLLLLFLAGAKTLEESTGADCPAG